MTICYLLTQVEVFYEIVALSNATALQWPFTNPKYWATQIGLIGLLDLIELKQAKKQTKGHKLEWEEKEE